MHTPSLPFGKNDTHGYFAPKSGGRLLLLVHGYGGNADTTWRGLPQQLILREDAATYDIISFGYGSIQQRASESANQLHKFLNKLLTKPIEVINPLLIDHDPSLRRPDDWKYTHVVIAGHSLGACVARRALLNQIQGGKSPWTARLKLMWFAPAHRGARPAQLLTSSIAIISNSLADLLDAGSKYFSPSLDDLARGSEFLQELLEETKSLCDNYPELKAAVTFWALNDKVVVNSHFAKDQTPFEEVEGANHVSICKPTNFDRRIELLLKEMAFE